MRKILLLLKLPLSIPSMIVYLTLKRKDYVDADMTRMGLGPGLWNLHMALNYYLPFRTIFRMRVRDESSLKYALIYLTYKPLRDLELGYIDSIGKGLVIWHGYGSVIGCKEIGENCTFYQGVTIGKGSYTGNGTQLASIGNGVSVCTGAIVIGGVTIGDNCKIGAGAVVNKDVPPNCTVVGNPMRIIKHD